MCEFASWKEYKGKVYFIKNSDLITKEGKKLLKPEVIADLSGHGAIEHYYPELKGKGVNKERTNFSTPKNFPKEIVRAIKAGKLSRIGLSSQLLTAEGWAEYEKIRQQAWAEYRKIRQQAWAEYRKIMQQAWAEYEKIRQPALAEYRKIRQQAWAEYEKIRQQAWAEYEKIEQPAWAEYEKIRQQAFWKIFKNLKYRAEVWR
jgi:hypothetical protein